MELQIEQLKENLRGVANGSIAAYQQLLTIERAILCLSAITMFEKKVHELDAINGMLIEKLAEIGDYAHGHSSGPAQPDVLWEVRRMAYDMVIPFVQKS